MSPEPPKKTVVGTPVGADYVGSRGDRFSAASEHLQSLLRLALDTAPIFLLSVDAEGTILAAYGMSPVTRPPPGNRDATVVGSSAWLHLRSDPELLAAVRRALAGETLHNVVHAGGRAWDLQATPITDANGFVTRVDCVAFDATAGRAQAEERDHHGPPLSERVKELGTLTKVAQTLQSPYMEPDQLLQAICDLMPGGFQRPEDVVAQITYGTTTVHSAPFPDGTSALRATFATEDGRTGTVAVYCPQAPEDLAHLFIAEEQDLVNNVAEMLRLHLERANVAAAAVAREHLLEQAERLGSIASWSFDMKTGQMQVSEELYRIYGIERHGRTIPAEQLTALIHPEDRSWVSRSFQDAIFHGNPPQAEFRILRGDGETRWVHVRSELVGSSAGAPAELRGVTQDVTARKLAEEAEGRLRHLEELNAFRAQFVSSAAHELNTPLTPIALQLDLLKEGRAGPLTVRQMQIIEVLDRNFVRLSLLVHDMLDAARLQANKLRIDLENTEIDGLVAEMVETFREKAAETHISLVFDRAPLPLALRADPRRVLQVVTNALSNAIKFTKDGGTITVKTRQVGGFIRLDVQDSGIGLREDQILRLFQPFVQVHDRPQTTRGTGLGLYISRGIVEQHGGRIWIESDGPCKGARLTVLLPVNGPSAADEVCRREGTAATT